MTVKETNALAPDHRMTLEGRRRLSLTGVTHAERFDETGAVLETCLGTLVVDGRELHVEQLDLEAGEVRIVGEVDSLVYRENRQSQGTFLQRLFR